MIRFRLAVALTQILSSLIITFGQDGLRSTLLNDEKCGVPETTPITEELSEFRIIGGNEARENSWPWQVSLRQMQVDGVFRHICGGTLVSPTKIISAVHCLEKSADAENMEVQLGVHTLSDTNQDNVVKVKDISYPKDNKPSYKWPSDIMVITLVHPVTYTDTISPACLGTEEINFEEAQCYVTGWGQNVSFKSKVMSETLQQLRVPVIKQDLCKKHIGKEFNPNKEMCAGNLEGGHDTCSGDSGGPLVCQVNERWSLYGVVSWGKGCAKKNSPGIYSKIQAHWAFLVENLARVASDDKNVNVSKKLHAEEQTNGFTISPVFANTTATLTNISTPMVSNTSREAVTKVKIATLRKQRIRQIRKRWLEI